MPKPKNLPAALLLLAKILKLANCETDTDLSDEETLTAIAALID